MHNGEPCFSHDAICAVLTSIREDVREMRNLEAALAESLKDLRQGFGEYRQEHETIVEELQRHAELLERVDTNARAVANGGLTAALEKALPAVLGALGVREQARCNMWQAIVVGGIGAAAGIIGTWLSLGK